MAELDIVLVSGRQVMSVTQQSPQHLSELRHQVAHKLAIDMDRILLLHDAHVLDDSELVSDLLKRSGTPNLLALVLDDCSDLADQQASEHWAAICRRYLANESRYLVQADYMDLQPDITTQMRTILVDWLLEVTRQFRFQRRTEFLTVSLVDRFLSRTTVPRFKLQLVGLAALMCAAKFEEVHPLTLADTEYLSASTYSRDDVAQFEVTMLMTLDFVLDIPTAAVFEHHFICANRDSDGDTSAEQAHLVQCLLDLALFESRMLRYRPSLITAAAVFLSNELRNVSPLWPMRMKNVTSYGAEDLRVCARELHALLRAAHSSQLSEVRSRYPDIKSLVGC